ncbi:MAG: methyl-accepting chemotaxis protein [Pseudomonas sp.]
MGLFNGKAQAQLLADQVAGIIRSLAEGNLDQSIVNSNPTYHSVYDALASLQQSLRQERSEAAQTEQLEQALAQMTAKHEEGWIDEIIPPAQFGGSHSRITSGINALVAAHIAVKMKIVQVVTTYGQGDFSTLMDRLPGKKAQITEAIDGVRNGLKAAADAADEARTIAAANSRIKSALDNVSANVMIADTDLRIIYMNRTLKEMLGKAEADIRKQLPNFSAANLMGANIDVFHKNPSHQRHILANLTGVHKAELNLGGRRFSLDVVPVFSDAGERLGAAVQWVDRTEEFRAEQEVSGLVEAAAAGDFSKRIAEENKEGFFLQMAKGLNVLVDTADRGLKDVARVLGAMAEGNLTQRIEADYQGTFGELKDFSNETTENLSSMLRQIRESADTINTASNEIASGNAELSTRTEQQAASLEETASSMEELTSTVKLNAENARQANSLAVNASEVATEGGNVVQKVVTTMSSINESARKISDIIGVIDGIAFQTNILALNAAVEAARAGEQGRGFAVVAGEVRTLAQRSAAAAKEIKTLISDSVSKVENGNTLVAQAGQTMSDIVVAIKRVTDIMAEIAAASSEQSRGIEEINGAVSQMDEMTQQNAGLVEEAATSAGAMQEQAALLSQAVAVFKLETGQPGAHSPVGTASPAAVPKVAAVPRKGKVAPRASKAKEEEWQEF